MSISENMIRYDNMINWKKNHTTQPSAYHDLLHFLNARSHEDVSQQFHDGSNVGIGCGHRGPWWRPLGPPGSPLADALGIAVGWVLGVRPRGGFSLGKIEKSTGNPWFFESVWRFTEFSWPFSPYHPYLNFGSCDFFLWTMTSWCQQQPQLWRKLSFRSDCLKTEDQQDLRKANASSAIACNVYELLNHSGWEEAW